MTEEEADRLVTEALNCDLNDPEHFVKMLLVLHDEEDDLELRDPVYRLMIAAYNNSRVHSANFQQYLDAVRQDRVSIDWPKPLRNEQ